MKKKFPPAQYICAECGMVREEADLKRDCTCGSHMLILVVKATELDPRRPFGTTREAARPQ